MVREAAVIAFVLTLLYTALTLLSPGVLPPQIAALHVAEIVGGITIVATLLQVSEAGLGSIPETYLAVGLLLSTALSMMLTGWFGGVAGTLLGFLPIMFNFFFIAISCRSLKKLKAMTVVLTLVACFIILQGMLAYHAGDFTSPYLDPENTVDGMLYRFRGLGVLNDPNDLGQLLVMLLPLLWLRWKKGNLVGNTMFTLVPAAILLFGIYLTHSRGGMVAVVAVLLFGFKNKLGLVKSALLTGLALAGMLALNVAGGRGMNEDDGGRIGAWATGLAVFRSHPLFGVGPGNFRDYNDTGLTAHNSYVLCLAELGLLGYFCWMGIIVSGWSGLSRASAGGKKKQPAEEDDGASLLPGAVQEYEWNARPWEVPDQEQGNESKDDPPEVEAGGDERVDEEEEFAYAASVMRVSLVGLLTAAFFLSRTYSMTLYVPLGMAVALRGIARPAVKVELGLLMKRIGMVMAGSILFLYLFVRLHGSKG